MRDAMRPSSVPPGPVLDAHLLARGMAVIRIFFGVILFVNGLAKLFAFTTVSFGPYRATLIDRDLARSILENEGARTDVPLVGRVAEDVFVANWGAMQWLVTAMELGVGALLILGLATRLAALAGLGQQLFLAALYATSSRWMFEQPHEWVPLAVLSLVPAGRVWGLDGRIIRRRPDLVRWPL
jgi:uncharacterized membrane protein YphA (DoxX/SURF4 family)